MKNQQNGADVRDEQNTNQAAIADALYLEGRPKQIRFDAKDGVFNFNGTKVLGKQLSFVPMAWRIFEDDILGLGKKLWAELFYVDESNSVAAVLFHTYSAQELTKLADELFYERLNLASIKLTVTPEKHSNDKAKATYYIAKFSYEVADKEAVERLQEFATKNLIYRKETLTETCETIFSHKYYNPHEALGEIPEAAAGEPEADDTEQAA